MVYDETCYIAESVRKGHPDKICDQISDAVLDLYLREDSNSHTAIECMGTKGNIIVAGEVLSKLETISVENVVRSVYEKIGYNDRISVTNLLSHQSIQLNIATDGRGANDQGVVYGYAERSGFNYLPSAVYIANMVAKIIDENSHVIEGLLPDGKVLVESSGDNIRRVIVNVQHGLTFSPDTLYKILKDFLSVFSKASSAEIQINNHDGFYEGGFCVDTGLTGRKLMIDTYGGFISHGGGAFSGKDPTKIDRTGAYMARFVAKNMVANGFADKCTIAIAYEFGEQRPISMRVYTEKGDNKALAEYIKDRFDFRPFSIIERFNLTNFTFLPTSTYGHFTDCNYPWENVICI